MRKRDTWEIIKNKMKKFPLSLFWKRNGKNAMKKNEHMTYTLSFRLFHFLYSRDLRV